jgi:hypothetical protein
MKTLLYILNVFFSHPLLREDYHYTRAPHVKITRKHSGLANDKATSPYIRIIHTFIAHHTSSITSSKIAHRTLTFILLM